MTLWFLLEGICLVIDCTATLKNLDDFVVWDKVTLIFFKKVTRKKWLKTDAKDYLGLD